MSHRRYPSRLVAARAGFTGETATARAAMLDDDPGTRATGLGALVRLGAATASDIEAATADPSPVVRRRAAHLAGVVDPTNPPVHLLDDEDPLVVVAACGAIGETVAASATSGRTTAAAAVDRIVAIATNHDDALCREAAVAALGAIGDPLGIDAVLGACRDVVAVRRRAVLMLAAWDDPRCDGALRALTTDRDRQVRQAAEDLLAL